MSRRSSRRFISSKVIREGMLLEVLATAGVYNGKRYFTPMKVIELKDYASVTAAWAEALAGRQWRMEGQCPGNFSGRKNQELFEDKRSVDHSVEMSQHDIRSGSNSNHKAVADEIVKIIKGITQLNRKPVSFTRLIEATRNMSLQPSELREILKRLEDEYILRKSATSDEFEIFG